MFTEGEKIMSRLFWFLLSFVLLFGNIRALRGPQSGDRTFPQQQRQSAQSTSFRCPDEEACKKIRKSFRKQGFDESEVEQVITMAAAKLGKKGTGAEMGEKSADSYSYRTDLVEVAEHDFGGLQIESVPSGAAIEIDNRPIDSKTNTRQVYGVGSHMLVLKKIGYEKYVTPFHVSAREWTRIRTRLKPAK